MTLSTEWPDDDAQTVKTLWKEGKSAGEISRALNNRYTRSAVLGKVNRMGLLRNGSKPGRGVGGGRPPIDYHKLCKEKAERGYRPVDIASITKLSKGEVEQIFIELGLDPNANIYDEFKVHRMWSLDEDDRRRAIAARASRGAREALRA